MLVKPLRDKIFISTHAPAGGATSASDRMGAKRIYFYSRPCGRGDAEIMGTFAHDLISTHAPAGGATSAGHLAGGDGMSISTHAPAGGATFYTGYDSICIRRFLLTPLREGRHEL